MDDQDTKPPAEDHPRFALIAKSMARFSGSGWAVATTLAVVLLWVAVGV